jgi:hypothetical protein
LCEGQAEEGYPLTGVNLCARGNALSLLPVSSFIGRETRMLHLLTRSR